MIKSLSILILLFTMINAKSQNLSSHQWKDRIIILLTEDPKNKTYLEQITELKKNESGLQERKLIVYQTQPKQFKQGLSSSDWKSTSDLYDTYKKTTSRFEFVLIGLDGGIKLQESELVSREKLFSVIDKMPMRRNELWKKE